MSRIFNIISQVRQIQSKVKLDASYTKSIITYVLMKNPITYTPQSEDEIEDAFLSIILKEELDEVFDIALKSKTEYIAIGVKDNKVKLID